MPSLQLGPPRDVKVTKVGKTHIVLTWMAPAGGVTGYQVSGRCGGEGACATLVEDTSDAMGWARVPVRPGWWELRVAAISEGQVGADSKLTQPVMTKGSESRRQSLAGVTPGRHGSRRRRSSTRTSVAVAEEEPLSDEGDKDGAQPSAAQVLEAEYAGVKRAMLAWEEAFVQAHGATPNEQERAASPRYRKAAVSYARLRGERQVLQAARQANEVWQAGLLANGVTLSEQVWELEAKVQQWEFEFVRINRRKPTFQELREDAALVKRQVDLVNLRQRAAALRRVLCAVSSHACRDGLIEARQSAVLAALTLFLSIDVNHDGRVTEDEFARLASAELPRLQGHERGTSFTHEQLQQTFAKADLNGDGEVHFSELSPQPRTPRLQPHASRLQPYALYCNPMHSRLQHPHVAGRLQRVLPVVLGQCQGQVEECVSRLSPSQGW